LWRSRNSWIGSKLSRMFFFGFFLIHFQITFNWFWYVIQTKWNKFMHGVGSEVSLSLCVVVVPFSHKGNVTSAINHAIANARSPKGCLRSLWQYLSVDWETFRFSVFLSLLRHSKMRHCVWNCKT
jgi:hypothetical protein